MAGMIRLQDVAREAGVSTVTASKALSGQKGVREDTRNKVKAAAQKLGYTAGGSGKDKSNNGSTIGVVVAQRYLSSRQSLYWTMYQELSRRLVAKRLFSVLEMVSREKEREGMLPSILDNPAMDGIIVMGSFEHAYMEKLEDMTKIPLVFLDTISPSGEYDSIVSNNFIGGYTVVKHLLDQGHEDIGFVGTLLVTDSIDDRFLGGQKALMQRGLEFHRKWILDDRDRQTLEISPDCMHLDKDDLPTAFFCNCDQSAALLTEKLNNQGLRVPEDISVAGFDNFITRQEWRDFLTTYDINMEEMARKAVHVMTHRIANPDYRDGMAVIQGHFLQRMSTAPINNLSMGQVQ